MITFLLIIGKLRLGIIVFFNIPAHHLLYNIHIKISEYTNVSDFDDNGWSHRDSKMHHCDSHSALLWSHKNIIYFAYGLLIFQVCGFTISLLIFMLTSLQILSCYFHQSIFVIKLHIYKNYSLEVSVYSQLFNEKDKLVEFCHKSAYN